MESPFWKSLPILERLVPPRKPSRRRCGAINAVGDSRPLLDYNVTMKIETLAEFNPYLKGRQSLAAVFARTVESSTAIEGVRLKLGEPRPTVTAKKRTGFRKPAKSSR